jgi:voltage-gated potassium channel
MDPAQRAEFEAAYTRATERPLIVLSVVFIAVFLIPRSVSLSDAWISLCKAVGAIIWIIFALNLAVRTWLAPHRLRYLLSHPGQIIVVFFPFLLSVGAVLAFVVFTRTMRPVRTILSRHGLQRGIVVGVAALLVLAGAEMLVERNGGGTIRTYGNALWWTAATVTTVGYGDFYPITPAGRLIAVGVMVIGVTMVSTITANVAAYFVEAQSQRTGRATLDDVLAHVRGLEGQIAQLRAAVEPPAPIADRPAGAPADTPPGPIASGGPSGSA